MTDRGKTFSPAMVRAITAGRKTQTRRLATRSARSQAGAAGDRIYVREHWKTDVALDDTAPRDLSRQAPILYLANGARVVAGQQLFGKHRQAMHMPRWASRITLLITEVRIEPLHVITAADAIAEGLIWRPAIEAWAGTDDPNWPTFTDPRRSYQGLWNSLHDEPGTMWDDNPDVIVTTFSVIRSNIDKIVSEATPS